MTILAMHMAGRLINCPVTVAMFIAALGFTYYSVKCLRRLPAEKVKLLAGIGALVFALQMVNFTLPGMPGTSGHFVGAALLAVLFGPWASVAVMSAVVIIQSLVFADGGLLALGCNIVNMAVVPAFAAWGVFRLSGKKTWSIVPAGIAAVVLGAVMVVLQSWTSGVLVVSVGQFAVTMIGVHLIIGAFEGVISLGIYMAVLGIRNRKYAAGAIISAALLTGMVLSLFASPYADGLEWACDHRVYGSMTGAVENNWTAVEAVENFQNTIALAADYEISPVDGNLSTSLAGLSGTLLVLAAGWAMVVRKRREA